MTTPVEPITMELVSETLGYETHELESVCPFCDACNVYLLAIRKSMDVITKVARCDCCEQEYDVRVAEEVDV
jgi:transcription elongation factor Elf1